MATDQGGTFDPFKQFGIFGIAFLIINAVLVVSTLIFFYFYKVYQLSLQYCICQEEVCIIAKIEQYMSKKGSETFIFHNCMVLIKSNVYFSFNLHYNLTFSVHGIRVGYRWCPSFKWIVKDQFRKHQTPSGIGFRSSSCHGHNSLYYSYRNWNSTHFGGVWTRYRWSIF